MPASPPTTITELGALRRALSAFRDAGQAVALVPTMGALHDGHLELVHLARTKADCVVTSIFVNPAQFAPHEDFDRYPRDLEGDVARLSVAGCSLVWAPDRAAMYPEGFATHVVPAGAAEGLEGAFRPNFFTGVATVCLKLFNQVRPDFAIFGEKDYQQLSVIRQIVRDLDLAVEIVAAPIVREPDGLAMSSRNRYLSPAERSVAPAMHKTILQAAKDWRSDGADHGRIEADSAKALLAAGYEKVDYVAIRDATTLGLPGDGPSRVLAAAWLGKTRLIDNVAA